MRQERRRFFRQSGSFPVVVHLMAKDEVVWGKLLNVGAGGLLVRLECPVPVGEKVSVQVLLDGNKPFFSLGRVARVHDAENHEYAFVFTQMSDEDRIVLFETMCNKLLSS